MFNFNEIDNLGARSSVLLYLISFCNSGKCPHLTISKRFLLLTRSVVMVLNAHSTKYELGMTIKFFDLIPHVGVI